MSEISQVVRTTSKRKIKIPKRYSLTHYYNETVPIEIYDGLLSELCDVAFRTVEDEFDMLVKNKQITFGSYSFEIAQAKIETLKFDALEQNHILVADMTEITHAN